MPEKIGMAQLSLEDVRQLALKTLLRAGAAPDVAQIMAQSILDAEAEGERMIGLAYLPVYCRHLAIGKVRGDAVPEVTRPAQVLLQVDARHGFCHPAYTAAETKFHDTAREFGMAGLGIYRSYSSAVLGWFCRRMASDGLLGLAFSNASPTMAAYGGKAPLLGTNPLAFGVPRRAGPPLVIDMSPAAVSRLEIKRHRDAGMAIPEGWGLDAQGLTTTDPAAILREGTILPAAKHKGFVLAMMVEILAAGLTGANWSFEASDLGNEKGGPPGIGQLFIAVDPTNLGGGSLTDRIEELVSKLAKDPGARLPGSSREEHRAMALTHGIEVSEELIATLSKVLSE